MKRLLMLCALLLASELTCGQLMFRNDFIITHKKHRLQNKGLTYVTFNAGHRHSWNLNAYGQPSKSIRIDVAALLGKKHFVYDDVIESMYRPMAIYKRSYIPIPMFLLLEPPPEMKLSPFSYFPKRGLSRPVFSAKADNRQFGLD